VVTSLLYFLRSIVMAQELQSFASKASFLATLNSYTAVMIAASQLLASGHLLRRLGARRALLAMPAVALAGMALVVARPHASSVALAEICRKLVGYTVSGGVQHGHAAACARPVPRMHRVTVGNACVKVSNAERQAATPQPRRAPPAVAVGRNALRGLAACRGAGQPPGQRADVYGGGPPGQV
jgi:hypothetical protein